MLYMLYMWRDMDHTCGSRFFNTTLLISLVFSLKILGHILKKLHPDSSQQQFNAKILWCILSGFAHRSVCGRYYPILSGMTWRMELSVHITAADSMKKVFCRYTTQEEHNLKGSCYLGEEGWKCNLVRTNTSCKALAGITNCANREWWVREEYCKKGPQGRSGLPESHWAHSAVIQTIIALL